jgi:hypothetical protein
MPPKLEFRVIRLCNKPNITLRPLNATASHYLDTIPQKQLDHHAILARISL